MYREYVLFRGGKEGYRGTGVCKINTRRCWCADGARAVVGTDMWCAFPQKIPPPPPDVNVA